MPVEIPTLSVAPSTIVCRLASGDLLDASPLQAANLILGGTALPAAVIAAGDLVLIQDLDDSLNLKTVTTQSIADLIGAGDVQGPAVATADAMVRFDSTTGKLIKNGVVIVTDAGAVTGVTSLVMAGALSGVTTLGMGGALTGITTLDLSGNLTTTGLIDGRDVAADGGVLDGIEPGADITDFTNVNAALVTPSANILVNSALGDFDFIVGGNTNANLLMLDALLDAVGIGAAAVSGSILTVNTTTSPLEFIESVFNAGLTVPAGTISGYIRVEIGGNILFINAYSVVPS